MEKVCKASETTKEVPKIGVLLVEVLIFRLPLEMRASLALSISQPIRP